MQFINRLPPSARVPQTVAFKRELLRFLRCDGVGWGREEGMARRIAEKAMWMECRVQVIAWGRAKTRVR